MKRRSRSDSNDNVRNKLIGLGENSMRKSYYPELRDRINELERFRALVEHANDALFVLDAFSWSFADVNATALKKTNYSREELVESPPESIFPKKTCILMRTVIANSDAGPSHDDEDISITELLGKDGVSVPVEITVRVHFVAGRLYLVMVARDVTRRLADQRELQKTRNYLGNVIDSMQSILVGVNEDSSVVLWNAYAVAETGVVEKDALGNYLFDVMPEVRKFKNLIERTIRNEEAGGTEIFTVDHSGETVFFEIVVFPFEGEGESGAVIRIDDITARTRMEEVMVQTEKMMTVGGLAAGMAHEINNPLGGILQGSQNILRRLSTEFQKNHEVARECGVTFEAVHAYCERRGIISKVESIQQLGKRSAKIVANMLQFSRQTGGQQFCTSLVEIMNTAIELSSSGYDLYQKQGRAGLEVIREFEESVPDIFCAPSEIEQVLINLIKNSVQAITSVRKEDPNKVGKIYVRIGREGNNVRLEIEDNGPGMDADTKKKALEPFFTTKGIGEGTGLGLFVSYFIITQKHKGSFVIETSPMLGTKIVIKLPVAPDCIGLD
ncbi:PAS domain S-box protein [Maridesulfovibrio ferrireducens]|uniref:PAS domain-containing sensor histidine kinase n=1 Tax=Maridesulfovibrio ferrireducens TaxID=246191 RepID=UPI001A239C93|nr:PAS domain S-box protein [Maridesulfovibrio ferrireducens]MBI9110566.1 PAS domain S-box protein [Maridesulfovibrio ferrireducens]